MATHHLKTWPEPFAAIVSGSKKFEARYADRKFKLGDRLCLREWVRETASFTGRRAWCSVTYLLSDGRFDFPLDWVVMSIERIEPPCSCTYEAGDSECDVHPRCCWCGGELTQLSDECPCLQDVAQGPAPGEEPGA